MAAKKGMFRLTYDINPMNTVKTSDTQFSDKHDHGVQPSAKQITSLLPELYANVTKKCLALKVAYPGDETVSAGSSVVTFSAK